MAQDKLDRVVEILGRPEFNHTVLIIDPTDRAACIVKSDRDMLASIGEALAMEGIEFRQTTPVRLDLLEPFLWGGES